MLIILLFVLLIITIIVLASGFPLNFFLKSLLSFLILCISLILFFYTPVMILGFLHSPLDHTFTGELKTRDYQYLGEFKYWIPHGEGKKIYSKTYHDGYYVSYDGGFRFNKYKGFGTLILWDGTEYVGKWKDNDTGSGVATFPNSIRIYEGSWTKNGLNGFGTMILNKNTEKDGIYTGEFKDNKFHGQGKYQWNDGEIYEGEFANSEPNGNGTLTTPTGQKFSGKFKNSILINTPTR